MSQEHPPYRDVGAITTTVLREIVQTYAVRAEKYSIFGKPVPRLRYSELVAALVMLIEQPELASDPAAVQRRA